MILTTSSIQVPRLGQETSSQMLDCAQFSWGRCCSSADIDWSEFDVESISTSYLRPRPGSTVSELRSTLAQVERGLERPHWLPQLLTRTRHRRKRRWL